MRGPIWALTPTWRGPIPSGGAHRTVVEGHRRQGACGIGLVGALI
jgi:hypothetical protein